MRTSKKKKESENLMPVPEEKCSPLLKSTHGLMHRYEGKDGVYREIGIHTYADGHMSLHLSTWWDGRDKDPLVTVVKMGSEAWNYVLQGMIELALNRDRWKSREE